MTEYPITIEKYVEEQGLPLECPWILWCASEHLRENLLFDHQRKQLYPVYRFTTIQGFYHAYHEAIKKMGRFVMMREGISPSWEDSSHTNGAHWTITMGSIRDDHQEKILDCVLGIIGESFTNDTYCSKKITGFTLVNMNELNQLRLWLVDDRLKIRVENLGDDFQSFFRSARQEGIATTFSPFRFLASKGSHAPGTDYRPYNPVRTVRYEAPPVSDGWQTVTQRPGRGRGRGWGPRS